MSEPGRAGRERARLVIVGAGIAGLGLAIRLRRAGRTDFVVLEAADDLGGVWRDNVYPGVACDIPSHLYSYSFLPKDDWSRVFAGGPEILTYLRDAAESEGVLPHLRFGTPMTGASWTDSHWRVTTPDGELEAERLVLAAGRLTEPRIPDVPGLVDFAGRVFHSSRWPSSGRAPGGASSAGQPAVTALSAAGSPAVVGGGVEGLAGLRVGVVGSGASAVQLVPHVAEQAAHTVVLQRTPAWVLPRGDRAYADGEARPDRADLAAEAERLFEARIAGSAAVDALRGRAEAHLAAQVPDPTLRALLTPAYEIGCKRAVFSDDWFPVLQRPDVTLEPSALAAVDGGRVVAASGATYDLDLLVLATGFETARQPYAPLVTGRHGRTLAEHWSSGMTSHASTVVAGFPNLFILDGPNATLGHHSAIEVIESQIGYVLGAFDHLDVTGLALEVSPQAEAAYTELIDTLAAPTVWLQGGCRSWYRDPRSGRLTLLWPERASTFRKLNGTFDATAFGPGVEERPRLDPVVMREGTHQRG